MVPLSPLGSMLCFIPEIGTEGELDSLIDCAAVHAHSVYCPLKHYVAYLPSYSLSQ